MVQNCNALKAWAGITCMSLFSRKKFTILWSDVDDFIKEIVLFWEKNVRNSSCILNMK